MLGNQFLQEGTLHWGELVGARRHQEGVVTMSQEALQTQAIARPETQRLHFKELKHTGDRSGFWLLHRRSGVGGVII